MMMLVFFLQSPHIPEDKSLSVLVVVVLLLLLAAMTRNLFKLLLAAR
jgi:hypothetical protein